MIDVRFVRLPKLGVLYDAGLAHGIPELSDGSSAIGFFPGYFGEIDQIVEVLNAIEVAYREDLAANPNMGGAGHSVKAYMAYRPRELWRVGSYVMFTTTLEGVIETRYEWLLNFLEAWDPNVRAQQMSQHARAVAERAEEMAPLVAVRNKVFAHTAWADPVVKGPPSRRDSPAVQSASLQYFAGIAPRIRDDGLHFGSFWFDDPADGDKLPLMSMSRLLTEYPPHLSAWYQMFVDVSKRLFQVPDATLKLWMPHVHTVIRDPDAAA